MKVVWVTLCKNEEVIIPYVIPYWKRIADKVVVYDNHSTDSSVELLSKYDWIEVRYFESEGQNEFIQKDIKEKAYLEFKNSYDIVILSDLDEIFYFDDFKAAGEAFINGGYNCLITPIHSLCEDSKPPVDEKKLLHQQCHKFYKQRMNHMEGFGDYSKISIFNCHTTDAVGMSVGQHYVKTSPDMRVMLSYNGFCIHVDKGLGLQFKWEARQRMFKNLSDENKKYDFCVEYAYSFEKLKKEYEENQEKSYDLNEILSK